MEMHNTNELDTVLHWSDFLDAPGFGPEHPDYPAAVALYDNVNVWVTKDRKQLIEAMIKLHNEAETLKHRLTAHGEAAISPTNASAPGESLLIQIPVSAPASSSPLAVRDTVQRFIDIGNSDANETVESGEGDLDAAQLAASLSFGTVSVVCLAPEARERNAVKVETGCDEGSQMDSFQNGTLQSFGDRLAVTIQTHVSVPTNLAGGNENQAEAFLREQLGLASSATGNLVTFEVQIGCNGDGEEEED